MFRGHGSPSNTKVLLLHSLLPVIVWLCAHAGNRVTAQETEPKAANPNVTCELRFVWGSATPSQFEATVEIDQGTLGIVRNLSLQPDSIGKAVASSATKLVFRPYSESTFGGYDLRITAPLDARIAIQTTNIESGETTSHNAILSELLNGTWIRPLGSSGGRVALERQLYDRLQVDVGTEQTIFSPGESFTIAIKGSLMGLTPGSYWLETRFAGAKPLDSQRVTIDESGSFPAVFVPVVAPETAGPHLLEFTLSQNRFLPSMIASKPAATRRLDIVVVDRNRKTAVIRDWIPLAEIDAYQASQPGSLAWLTPEQIRNTWPVQTMTDVTHRLTVASLGSNNPLAGSFVTPVARGQFTKRTVSAVEPNVEGNSIRCLSMTPGSHLTIPIDNLVPGQPHRLVVDIPVDEPMRMALLLDRNAAHSGASAQTAIELLPQNCRNDGSLASHDLIFWPVSSSTELTIANVHSQWSSSVKTIHVEQADLVDPDSDALNTEQPIALGNASADNSDKDRHGSMYLNQPILADSLGVERTPDPTTGRRYESWQTWYTAVERLHQLMSWKQAETLYVTVGSSGGAICINSALSPTLRFDSGPFFSDGRSPNAKDIAELLLLLADRNDRRVVLMLSLDAPLESLEAESLLGESLRQSSVAGELARTQYDPLHKSVQQTIQQAVASLVSRYAKHPSFAGIGFQLSRRSHLVFRGDRWGYSQAALVQFAKSLGGKLATAATTEQLFAQPTMRSAFLQWRAGQLAEFYQGLASKIAAANPTAKLYINPSRLWSSRPDSGDFYSPDLILHTPAALLLGCGLKAEQLAASKSIHFLTGGRPDVRDSVSAADWTLDLASKQLDFDLASGSAASAYSPNDSRRITLAGGENADTSTAVLYPQLGSADRFAVADLIEQMYASDCRELVTGGWTPRQGDTRLQREIFQTLNALPNEALQTVNVGTESNIRVRRASTSQSTFLHLVNNAPWPEVVKISVRGNAELNEVGPQLGRVRPGNSGERISSWQVSLRAFDTIALRANSPALRIVAVEHQTAPRQIQRVAGDLTQLEEAVLSAGDPSQRRPLVELGGEFERWNDDRPFGWTLSSLPQVDIARSSELPHSGRSNLRIVNRGGDSAAAWIQSRAFSPPRSGRLLVETWLRVSAASQPMLVRISLTGRTSDGQTFERSQVVGGKAPEGKRLPIDWGRRPFELLVSDIPSDSLQSLKVAIELIGGGRIWVDDVAVYELALMPEEIRHIRSKIMLAKQALDSGNCYPAYEVLSSHWGRYMNNLIFQQQAQQSRTNLANENSHPDANWNKTQPVFQRWRDSWRNSWAR